MLLAPWYLQSRLLFNDIYAGTTFPFEPIRILTWIIPSLNFGRTVSEPFMLNIWWLVFGLLFLGIIVHWRRNHGNGFLLALTGFLPPILLALVSLKMNVFTPRYILAVVPIYILLISALIVNASRLVPNAVVSRAFSILVAGGWLLIISLSLNNLYFSNDYAKSVNWRGLTNYLRENVSNNDVVIQAAADEAFTLYFDSLTNYERIPASPLQSSSEIISTLEDAAINYDSIWLVARTPGDWPNRAIGLDWLDRNLQQVRQTTIGIPPVDLPVQQFKSWQVQSSEIETKPLAMFQDIAQLVGVQVSNSIEPTGELVIWAYWQPIGTTEKPLKAFVHVVGPINPATNTPLWAQDDQFPQDNRINTTIWDLTTVYRDVFNIPLTEVPPGQYTLYIGLYEPGTGNRIPTESGDSYEIGPLTVP